ncbi:hypothetical protein [Agromyces bauzanensis]|uniref:Uncharacterized protein n=1 Tax=Agromyces bauzanensis TaxID=1308924 RepID=A0A917PIZ1_9MICO|nr:hypothetical protein [Agromyces bauzanensis]GGJ81231.1 hypothetical protein GCM10011372_19530 [Agromyces bauzanensis]
MLRFLIRIAFSLVTSALGLLLAMWILPGFHIEWGGFLVAILVFTIAQAVLATLIVWIVTALGAWLLPLVFLKRRAGDRANAA